MKNKTIVIGALLIMVLAVVWWLVSPLWRVVSKNESLPEVQPLVATHATTTVASGTVPMVLASSPLVASEHAVSGSASFVQVGDKTFLRFEDLDTVNGPDLRIYLATDTSADDVVDLGPIRATKGNVNYELPAGTDVTKYSHALIWCRAFHKLFSYAKL